MDFVNAWVTYKCRSIYGTKPDDTSFEFTNMQTLLNTNLHLSTQLKNVYMNIGTCFSNTCMNESRIKRRKMNQMVYWIICYFSNNFIWDVINWVGGSYH